MTHRSSRRARIAVTIVAAAVGAVFTGCGDENVVLPRGDFGVFVSDVQPVLAARCANPSCHGNADRPLEVYAPELHRLDPDDLFLKTPLTHDELEANRLRAAAFIQDLAGDSSLLRKPLALSDGGMGHRGGVCFESTAEPGWRAMQAWVTAALDEAAEGQP